MKKFIAAMLVSVMFGAPLALAGEEYSDYKKEAPKPIEEREVIFYDFDMEVEVENGVVEAEWEDFDRDGFDWFKLVYSTTNSSPAYPTDKTVFVGTIDQTEASFKLDPNADMHYIRICAVVLNDDYSKDRHCGDVVTLEGKFERETYEKQEYKKDYEKVENKEEYKKDYQEKKQQVVDKAKAKKMYVSKRVKERIDTILESFIEGLEERDFSDAEIVETIDVVLERLENYKDNEKLAGVVNYMEKVLEDYRSDYDSGLDELGDIFSDL